MTSPMTGSLRCRISSVLLIPVFLICFTQVAFSLDRAVTDTLAAKKYAADFINNKIAAGKGSSGRKGLSYPDFNLVYLSPDTCRNDLIGFSIRDGGYIFTVEVNGDILVPAYSLTGSFDPKNASPEFLGFINAYESSKVTKSGITGSAAKGAVAPLLEIEGINWDQGAFYNDNCPYDAEAGTRTWAGCVSVAMAQIMRYHKHPAVGAGSHSYTHNKYGLLSADFGAATYNWASMPGALTGPNPEVAKLFYHIGVSVDMAYGVSTSGASVNNVPVAFRNYFRYPDVMYAEPDFFPWGTGEYISTLRAEIDNHRPFFYELLGPIPHAVVIDGYDGDYFHVNFGWSGVCNGYFLLSGTEFVGSYQFGFRGNSIINISPVHTPVNQQDSLALVAIYNSTNGQGWYNKTNWLTGRITTWYGVDIVNGRVVHLRLTNNNLTGPLPPELGNLTNLTYLNLGDNKISGSIPSGIGNLTKLADLILSLNRLTGIIPPEISNCHELYNLALAVNSLTGPIPAETGQLTNLKIFNVAANQLTGSVPASFSALNKLETLSLSENKLSGTIPDVFSDLHTLYIFSIDHNEFTGPFPSTFTNMPNLAIFEISDNKLEGPLPEAIGTFTNLLSLNINNNQFTSLPESIGNLTKVTRLNAINNRIAGMLPESIGNMAALKFVNLSNNLITQLPEDFGKLTSLQELNLSGNRISSLPPSMGDMRSLTNLTLSSNLLTSLPYEMGNLGNLTLIYVDNNKLSELTFGVSLMKKLIQLNLSRNELTKPLPPLSHLGLQMLYLDHNNLSFEDMASSGITDGSPLSPFYYNYQKSITLEKEQVEFLPGDSVGVDIREISELSHPNNSYKWYKNGTEISSGPVLSFKNSTAANQGDYYCRIVNNKFSNLILYSDTVRLQVKSSTNPVSQADTLLSFPGGSLRVAADSVTLIPPETVRGTVTWQASKDSIHWIDLINPISDQVIKNNIRRIGNGNVVVDPSTSALYRYKVVEGTCAPLFSDTVVISAFKSQPVIDTLLPASSSTAVIKLSEIEIIIPGELRKDGVRLTIDKILTPPQSPDSVNTGAVFDVKLGSESKFSVPLVIKLKIARDTIIPETKDRYLAVYYDETKNKWVKYATAGVDLSGKSIIFETDHLTKLAWWEKKITDTGFSDRFTRDGVTVYYKEDLLDLMNLYKKNQSAQPWHLVPGSTEYGTPLLVQDMAHYTREIMDKFKTLGLTVPESITIYADNIEDYGVVGLLGMTNGYLTISIYIEEPDLLKGVLAHEYMHYTQDYYILAQPGNQFWMEANAPLADRMVWDQASLPLSEGETYMLDNRSTTNSIFKSLAQSWDYWDSSILTQNLMGNINFCYLAGCFIHYMRSYKSGVTLKPEILLKETSYTGSWKNYLAGYIESKLNSKIGDQFEDYVTYIMSGVNTKFTLLNNDPARKSGDPLSTLIQAPEEFNTRHLYKIPDQQENVEVIRESIDKTLPYLSSKMEQFFNLSANRALCVRYKRTHADTAGIKVYLCKWDDANNRMNMVDVSRKDSSFFFIEPATEENVSAKSNQAFLLFINKNASSNLELGYDLEILPVADFDYLFTSTFSAPGTSDLVIHNYTDGFKRKIIIGFNQEIVSMSKVYTDSSFTSVVTGSDLTQEIDYNFRNGQLRIRQTRNFDFVPIEDPEGCLNISYNEVLEIELKNVFLSPFDAQYVSMGAGIYRFVTTSTADTRSKMVSLANNVTYTNTYPGGVTTVSSYSYTDTDWDSVSNIILSLQFK